ncbi:MAG: sensor histidine kinase [Clostridiales bacterium]|nr:sensor histidine kinase [Clostridiales bacterium]
MKQNLNDDRRKNTELIFRLNLPAGALTLAILLVLRYFQAAFYLSVLTAVSYLMVLVWQHLVYTRQVEPLLKELLNREKSARENEYKAESMRVRAEIHALQSQINPHFLYNTLETIRSIALSKNAEDIALMTESLSEIFRYAISKPGEMATVKEELSNVRSYLLIQQYRYPNKLSYCEEIEDEQVLDYRIPILTIQPIIENAVSHGLEMKVGNGVVRFHAYMTDCHVVMRISDNGVGMSEEALRRLRIRLASGEQPEDGEEHRSTGIALCNVNQRLKFYFGEQYGLNIMSTTGTGTIVEVTLPIHEEGNTEG